MIGVVDVGGGLRAIYGAGVLDRCLDEGIHFDYGIGVSAGSANIASYFGNQKGRNYVYYSDYAFRKEYMSFNEFRKHGSYVNLNYIYGSLSNHDGEYPLDFETMMEPEKNMKIVATDAHTGDPIYFDKSEMQRDDYGAFKCSCCIPVISKPYQWKGGSYFDGGLSDPVPIKKALEDGCDRVVVILTKPKNFLFSSRRDAQLAHLIYHYPMIRKALKNRANLYNNQMKTCLQLEKQGKVLIIAPESIAGMKTLTKDKEKLDHLYQNGYNDADSIKAFIRM